MKTRIFTLLALTAIVLCTQNANATIRRVGYFGTPRPTDYIDLQNAHDAAAAGDTILMFPGSWGAAYSKRLVTLGYGYFVDTASLTTGANFGLQNITAGLSIGITLAAGSNNSTFEGLDGLSIHGDGSGATLSNITIRRCNIGNGLGLYGTNTFANWQVLQSYITYFQVGGSSITNIVVNNCYIYQIYNPGFGAPISLTGQFNNCIYYYVDFSNGSFIIRNSIFTLNRVNDINCAYSNNVINTDYGSLPGNGNVNISGYSMVTDVFVGYSDQSTYSNDGRFALKPGSPAIGAGVGGTNCGIFGGANPYKLSGIPRIPAFYKLTAPSNITSTNPYTITFSVRSNN